MPKLEEAIAQVPLEDYEGQMAVTDLLDAVADLSCDKHGRIKLNEDLIEGASLIKGAVLLGKVATFIFIVRNWCTSRCVLAKNLTRRHAGRNLQTIWNLIK